MLSTSLSPSLSLSNNWPSIWQNKWNGHNAWIHYKKNPTIGKYAMPRIATINSRLDLYIHYLFLSRPPWENSISEIERIRACAYLSESALVSIESHSTIALLIRRAISIAANTLVSLFPQWFRITLFNYERCRKCLETLCFHNSFLISAESWDG